MRVPAILAALVATAAVAWSARAATPAPPPPPAPDPHFKIPRAQVIATVKSIGVLPVTVANVVPDAEAVAQRLETQILARMAPAGFGLVSPEAMKEIQGRARTALGGLYDPVSGRPIQDKLTAYREYVSNEYRHEHPVDAWLLVRVIERLAFIKEGAATWDGVSDSSNGRTGFARYFSGGKAQGNVPALSLLVQLSAADGRLLYENVGGLQVLEYVTGMTGHIDMSPVDPKFIMTDPARDERALGIALDPLASGEAAKPVKEPSPPPTTANNESGSPNLSRTELLSRFHRVALGPLELGAIEQHNQAQARYSDLLRSRLTQLGFEVVPADDLAARWREELKNLGGLHDPFTGRMDEAKYRAARTKIVRATCEQYGVGAVVLPIVESGTAPYRGDEAAWHGVKESATTAKSGFTALFSPTQYGYVKSLSLSVRFFDADGIYLFHGQGGIQLEEHLDGLRHVSVPEQDLFADPARDQRAVEIALHELEPPLSQRSKSR
jgi:hypothetical protein